MGLSLVSAAGATAQSAVNKAAAGAARGGRNAELESKGRHSDNAFRLDPLSLSVSMSTWCCKCDEVGVTPHTAHLKLDQFFVTESYPYSHGVSVCPPVCWQPATLTTTLYLKVP